MGWRALGDSAWLFEPGGTAPAERLGRVLGLHGQLLEHRIDVVTDIVASFETIAVHFDPADGEIALDWLLGLPPAESGTLPDRGRRFDLPVEYGGHGSDLDDAAQALGLARKDVVRIHCGAEYLVAAVGFSPGFPYLLGLDPHLALPRKSTPRLVPAGAVAIANGQAGVYPSASQGGWHVLGRTDSRLFDPSQAQPALLRPGDRVRFIPAGGLSFPAEKRDATLPDTGVTVSHPGFFSTIQDLGRPGVRDSGVTSGGAADPVAAQTANLLVGNPEHAALIECVGNGPVLRFDTETTVACMGWAEGSGIPRVFPAGDILDLRSRMNFSHGYIAVAGGIDVPLVLGSRSTDVRAGFGGLNGRPLRKLDRIPIGNPQGRAPRTGDWRVAWPRAAGALDIRFIAGMQSPWFDRESRASIRRAIYQKSAAGDRTGMRLNGPPLHLTEPRGLVSQPVVAGSIQVPPDGVPVILMSECQTIGGYPQIGHVISADLPSLARALPGTPVTFREVSLAEAREAWLELRRDLSLLETGLSFLP